MTVIELSGLLIALLFVFLAAGLWVAFALTLVAVIAITLSVSAPAGDVLAVSFWSASHAWDLTALPMFIWMGEILFRSRLSDDLFSGLSPWLAPFPGRLIHVNVFGSAIFAAVSGSSAATTATVGKISLPELESRGYDERLAIGSLAGSSTLGLLIPPSIIMIVYGAATEQSIARLFIAGVVPGLVLVALFTGYISAWALLNRKRMPPPEPSVPWSERLYAVRRLAPVVLLIVGVIGSIYAGLASPTEAAVIGVVLSLLLSWLSGAMSAPMFREALIAATRTSCMIAFILAGAAVLTTAMGFTGIPRELATWIGSLGLGNYALLCALTVFFIVLGCFLDGISMVILTTSVIMPLIEAAGFDLIWFGIYLVLVVEMAQITPPVGFNLFVIQGLTGRSLFAVARYATPFFLLLIVAIVLLTAFPELALWLPTRMFAAS